MTYDEMIAVITGAKARKTIQQRAAAVPGAQWHACPAPRFNFTAFDYRIKPEPRKVYVVYRAWDTPAAELAYANKADAEAWVRGRGTEGYSIVEFIEKE